LYSGTGNGKQRWRQTVAEETGTGMALAVAAIGECMLELSGRGGNLWLMGFAGDTFNTLWTLRALCEEDCKVDYVSAFGDDPFSADQIAFFAKHRIGIARSPIVAGTRPGMYAITLSGAERSFTYWRGDSAARQLASQPSALTDSLKGCSLIYFSGITLAILTPKARGTLLVALRNARAGGARIAFDPNYRARLWPDPAKARQAMVSALEVADIVLPTFSDEAELFADASPDATITRLGASGIAEAVVKNGDADAHVWHGGKATTAPAAEITSLVDTTGAGDAFNGAYLAARLLGHEPPEAARRAHRVAGTVVQVRGALAPFDILQMAFER